MKPIIFLLILSLTLPCLAQTQSNTEQESNNTPSISASLMNTFVPADDDILSPTLGVAWDNLYLEGRYNYESEDTTSLWVGIPFNFGEELSVDVTPMLGAIFGDIEGAAPGVELDLTWRKINLYTEAEYVFDFDTRDENFFYSWTELSYAWCNFFSFGLAATRTRLYDSSVEVDRGPLVSLSYNNISLSGAALNIDSDPLYMLWLSYDL